MSVDSLSLDSAAVCGVFTPVAVPGPSQFYSTNNLDFIEKILDEAADQDTLILWDVDQTLITPQDPIGKPKYEKLLDQITGGKVIKDPDGNKRYIFREIMINAPQTLIDRRSLALIEKFQDKGIPNIAFTAAPGGKIGKVDNFVDWRVQELERFGFHFDRSLPQLQSFDLPKDAALEFPPVYRSGVLVTSLHDKGPVLSNFIQNLERPPKKIIFIDDQKPNVDSVIASLQGSAQVIGIQYTGAADLPCDLNEEAARRQVAHYLETGEWISQEQAAAK
ncbi:MAG: DUF2608 domain-containing protein [Verrucomicrobia bacterium]|nr:DUF2608 domain-containing protein [Verrucomicrobiota bacterium]